MPRAGYTLIELLVVIAILALLAALAVPATGRATQSMTIRSQTRLVAVALRRLEEEAARTQQTITLEESSGDLTTSTGRLVYASGGLPVELPEPISFYPDGTTEGGRLLLHGGSQDARIDVAWLTGDITVGVP